jgi:hypothetical protein
MIDPTSRYYRSERATYPGPDGNDIPYLKRRLLPPSGSLAMMSAVTVTPGQRLDVLAARYQGDPLQFWRIADANDAMNPFDLVAFPGRQLRVPKPGQ